MIVTRAVDLLAEKSRSGSDLLQVLESAREEDPEEPFWSGVERMTADRTGIDVAWHEPREPRLRAVDEVEVACHLYDPAALQVAEESRAST